MEKGNNAKTEKTTKVYSLQTQPQHIQYPIIMSGVVHVIHLRSITAKEKLTGDTYPFTIPVIQQFSYFQFSKPVTMIIGENGTGKSTFLEAIASHVESISISGESMDSDPSLEAAQMLAQKLTLSWTVRQKKGFFFRASDFIHFTERTAEIKRETTETLKEIKAKDPYSLEALPYANTLHDLKHLYGEGLEVRSHGEQFLDLFQARFRPGGLYILDEPEAPLSPLKQLSLITMINDMVKDKAQFIIATHSPILMAIPNADLYVIEDDKLKQTEYETIEHVTLTRDFLNNPARYLRHL